jgi:hypothetical protein
VKKPVLRHYLIIQVTEAITQCLLHLGRGATTGVAPTSSLSNANLNALAKAKLFLPESTRYPLSATLRKESEW